MEFVLYMFPLDGPRRHVIGLDKDGEQGAAEGVLL
jgi:hypothetical protein